MSLISAYNPLPVQFVRGEGVWLFDADGRQYLDALSGIAVCNLGHAHPDCVKALGEQNELLWHTSNLYQIEQQQILADKLTRISGMQQVFFGNSGAEANEAAIKLARLHGHKKGIDVPHIIVTEKAFHGRTMATLTATGNRKAHAGFEPLLPGFVRAPFNDFAAIESIVEQRDDIAAIFVEPIQGEGGIHVASIEYLQKLRTLCDQKGLLLMMDEIQTGAARTGQFYRYQAANITPDVVASAKGLGNGFPIGACLMSGNAVDLFVPGKHGSTFGGNPLACKVANAVIDTMERDNIIQHAAKIGGYLKQRLQDIVLPLEPVTDIRGQGLMLGIEVKEAERSILHIGLEHGILFSLTAGNVLRLLPPLIITQHDADSIVSRMKAVIEQFFKVAA